MSPITVKMPNITGSHENPGIPPSDQDRSDQDNTDQIRKREEGEKLALLCSDIRTQWNAMAEMKGLPTCRDITENRRKAIRARAKDRVWLHNWKDAISAIPSSDFLVGYNPRKWKAGIDWFLKPDSVTKILEGRYANDKIAKGRGDSKEDEIGF